MLRGDGERILVRMASLDEIWARASKGITAAGVIVDPAGRVLLVKHSYGPLNWELPGGAAEPDESPTETAVREVREETGLRVAADRLTGVYYEVYPERRGSGHEAVHFAFLCHGLEAGVRPRPSCDEITACAYWPVDALPRPLSDFTERRIHDALRGRGALLPIAIEPRRWLP
jgi:8-oxo-dGTP diphosphatase